MQDEAALAAALATCERLRRELAHLEGQEDRLLTLQRQRHELEARAQVLERANAALEDFAYAASHDLQAPLRAITHFATWIEEDLPAEASDAVRMYVSRLHDRVERMTCLQEKLLDYARIHGQRPEIEAVEPGALVRDVWSLVMPPGGFTLVLESAAERCALATEPLRTVLRNLFSNAITHHDAEEGLVTVHVRGLEHRIELDVLDDGPGVPAEEAERIFRATHVLRPTDASKEAAWGARAALRGEGRGTGMGLAIARRHAEHVGGAVYLVPGSGRGAHFRVEWPIGRNTPPSLRPEALSPRPETPG